MTDESHNTAQPPYLTDAEVSAMCEPLRQPAAQCRYLKNNLKLMIATKPNGRPLVLRTELDRVLGASRFRSAATESTLTGPNVAALRQHLTQRKSHAART